MHATLASRPAAAHSIATLRPFQRTVPARAGRGAKTHASRDVDMINEQQRQINVLTQRNQQLEQRVDEQQRDLKELQETVADQQSVLNTIFKAYVRSKDLSDHFPYSSGKYLHMTEAEIEEGRRRPVPP